MTSTDVPVAIDPSQLNKPQMPDTQAGNGDELLKHKLGLANKHAKDAKLEADEAKKQLTALQQEMQALKQAQQSAVQKNLEDQEPSGSCTNRRRAAQSSSKPGCVRDP